MPQISRNKSKYKGLKAIIKSIDYSIDGLVYAYRSERSMIIHTIASIIGIVLGFILGISLTEWSIILGTLAIILAIELINTAVEAVVDMVTQEYHPLAKVAKDCSSAATFVVSASGVIIGIVIFVPKILVLLDI